MEVKHEILIIDDEPQMRKLLQICLESNGYAVSQACNAKEGCIMAANHPPNLILLDIGLPDMSGHDLLKDLRQWFNKAILVLSVQNREEDIVSALDNGATDYLTKPFRTAELLARIRTAIRNARSPNRCALIKCRDLEIDLVSMVVKKNGEALKLTSTEYKLIAFFAANEGRVLTHQSILKEIWGMGYQMETQYLRVFVASLRKKIESQGQKFIHTESGVGYRFA